MGGAPTVSGSRTPRWWDAGPEIYWMTKGGIHFIENYGIDDWSAMRTTISMTDWCDQGTQHGSSVSLEYSKDSTRRMIEVMPRDCTGKDVCCIYVGRHHDVIPRWIMIKCPRASTQGAVKPVRKGLEWRRS